MPVPASRKAYDLIGRCAALPNDDRAQLACWRRDVFELLMTIDPTKRGRHHAPETDEAVALVDDLLALRGRYLASRTSAVTVGLDWDMEALEYLGTLARW
jgi:hypothetical protein